LSETESRGHHWNLCVAATCDRFETACPRATDFNIFQFVAEKRPTWKTGDGKFLATHWSMVVASAEKDGSGDAVQAALTQLFRDYWSPLYAFVRRRGYATHDAQDLTQGFFAFLLESRAHGQADPRRGKFRSFLLASLKNFLANEWDKQQCLKRGGSYLFNSLEGIEAEERHLNGMADYLTPEKLFDRRWAQTILDRVLARLRGEYAAAGQPQRFEIGKEWLLGDNEKSGYAGAAATLGLEETGMRTLVHRLRRRFRELMRTEIAATVTSPEQLEEEIRSLFEALRG
jgi:RNA polymerase sigma-70 factor (ECF subfamily)